MTNLLSIITFLPIVAAIIMALFLRGGDAAADRNAKWLALLTTTAPMMRVIVNALQAAGVRDEVKVLVGGAAVSQEFADEIGADGYAPDAGAAVRKAKELLAVAA